ncbi:hypothetical protein F4813DRAFT_311464 [Daldinia decipiens]|uniref:uncharacterized protein n=1 Tax=Daldinia decipiens TaxID=326647 RepID=UPI0020C4DD14|nr:uncharacterized protein F4813DRAFT_311464 [Daldinia decipiens]KAI1660046.1 hypothetical protein F4813DRAFT_311464 [Daldinia decipiens]
MSRVFLSFAWHGMAWCSKECCSILAWFTLAACFYRISFQFDSYILVDLNSLRHKLSQKRRPTLQSTTPSQSLSEGIAEGQ